MTWVTVKDFDQDVKVGDKVRVDNDYSFCGTVTAIGKMSCLIMGDGREGYISKESSVSVWRETKRWRGLIGFCFRTKEQAQEYADECKKVAERLHERFKE